MKTKDRRKIFTLIFIAIIILVTVYIFFSGEILKKENNDVDKQIETSLVYAQNLNKENEIEENNISSNTTFNTTANSIMATYKGYPVIAKLEIPKIKLETYVISEYSEQALGVSVTKFFGGNPNEIGNFCIAGHNYITKNMFHDLKKLSIGDTFSLIDNNSEGLYKIYLVETVEPDETQCLSQQTNGRIEVTLITCTSDSSKRIIIKAVKM